MPSDYEMQLPQLREDLQLLEAPNTHDGSQTWTLYDPVSNRFFRVGMLAYLMLCNWSKGNSQELIHQIINETAFLSNP